MGRINRYGELVYVGRVDSMIKLMGRRIELSEIEKSAERFAEVSVARCFFDEERQRICLAFVGECSEEKVFEYLKGVLPGYMLPRMIRGFNSFPCFENGKTDVRALKSVLFGG